MMSKCPNHNVSPDITLEFCQQAILLNVACATLNVTMLRSSNEYGMLFQLPKFNSYATIGT